MTGNKRARKAESSNDYYSSKASSKQSFRNSVSSHLNLISPIKVAASSTVRSPEENKLMSKSFIDLRLQMGRKNEDNVSVPSEID